MIIVSGLSANFDVACNFDLYQIQGVHWVCLFFELNTLRWYPRIPPCDLDSDAGMVFCKWTRSVSFVKKVKILWYSFSHWPGLSLLYRYVTMSFTKVKLSKAAKQHLRIIKMWKKCLSNFVIFHCNLNLSILGRKTGRYIAGILGVSVVTDSVC